MISKGSVHESKGTNLQKVASAVQLQNSGGVASQSEIDFARELLTATIKGLAYSFVERSGDDETWVKELKSDYSRNALRKLRENSTVVTGEKKIMVPKHKEQVNEMKPVRKITFSPAFEKVENGHPAPDPLLLAVKAGLNWSAFHEQRLMPASECDESDSDMSERSIAAMEEYLAMREHHERARRNKEIMNMTIRIS